MKIIFSTFFVIISQLAYAQFAIVRDKDGFVNVRQAADVNSKVLDKLSNETIIFCFPEEAKGEWLPVDYAIENQTLPGFIHKSRVVFIDSLRAFHTTKLNDSLFSLKMDSIEIQVKTARFKSKEHKIKYDGNYVQTINNKTPWGTDGNLPKQAYKSIQFFVGKKSFLVPKNQLADLFEPNLIYTSACIDPYTNKLYLYAMNSDAAGGYAVIWVFKNGKFISRGIYMPF
jgi:hypothetical protein